MVALLAALTLAGTWTGPASEPAAAAFPGQNGRIAFVSDRIGETNPEGDPEIFSMNRDGSGVQQLTENDAVDDAPVWSADGTRIAFKSDRDGNNEVYSMRANGAKPTNRPNDIRRDTSPDWQPR